MDNDHHLGTCKHGRLYLRGCDECEQAFEGRLKEPSRQKWSKTCPYPPETFELDFSIAESNVIDSLTVERESFRLWWEAFKQTYPDWRSADSDALRYQAWLAGAEHSRKEG